MNTAQLQWTQFAERWVHSDVHSRDLIVGVIELIKWAIVLKKRWFNFSRRFIFSWTKFPLALNLKNGFICASIWNFKDSVIRVSITVNFIKRILYIWEFYMRTCACIKLTVKLKHDSYMQFDVTWFLFNSDSCESLRLTRCHARIHFLWWYTNRKNAKIFQYNQERHFLRRKSRYSSRFLLSTYISKRLRRKR